MGAAGIHLSMRATLATLVDDFRRWGPATAVGRHTGNRRHATSYSSLARLAGRFAGYLEAHSLGSEQPVLLWGQNSAEWIGVFFGCVLRGAVVAPLDAAGSVEFARRVIEDVRPSLIVGDSELVGRLTVDIPILVLEELESALPAGEGPANPALSGESPLQILFTSGTTGEPKGIVHTHRNVLASLTPIEREIEKYRRYERWVHPLRFLHTLPLSHVFGQFMGLWVPAVLGAEVHFDTRLAAPHVIALLRRERISVLAAVPRVLALMRTHLETEDAALAGKIEAWRGIAAWKKWWRFRSIHRRFGWKFWAFVCGGAALPPELERFWNALGFVLIQGYGMTETTALITLNHPFRIAQGSIGRPLPGREVRIGPDGEVLVRGEMVSTKTWQNGRVVEREDPWLATGDLAEKTASGELRFLGRKGDAIVTAAGVNIFPQDLEAALDAQAGVRASAVLGVDTPSGREPMAVIAFAGTREEAARAVEKANAKLAEYQRIRRYELWTEPDLPRTSTGKVQKRKIAAWLSGLGKSEGAAVSGDWLLATIAALTGERTAAANDASRLEEDLHMDSLARVQLAAALEERVGTTGDEQAFQQLRTLGELRQWAGLQTAAREQTAELVAPQERKAVAQRQFVYPKWPWRGPIGWLRVAFQEVVVRPLVWLLAGPRVWAAEKLPPGGGAMLVIANHLTAVDVPLVLYGLPFRMRRRMAVAMSGEMLDDWRHGHSGESWLLDLLAPAAYWLVTALFNVFPLPGSAGFQRSFDHAGEALDRGFHVLVFPEGRRSQSGELQSFRGGIGLLVKQSEAAVLPVALAGLGELKQERRRWFHSGRVEVRTGCPLRPKGSADLVTAELEAEMRNLLRRREDG
ncbi:long-chain acyl-CoA synthetase [Acidipila rosea]|uniref:Long-chain acyl-CoA synthetase n=2 Tax=Acidipila rosea TaxID=768535 RepID=A0A4R1L5Q8_9BACT|nr:long-chain acyl-CoA synthetase [Acidipila rosea]